jgi:hypothetical protein
MAITDILNPTKVVDQATADVTDKIIPGLGNTLMALEAKLDASAQTLLQQGNTDLQAAIKQLMDRVDGVVTAFEQIVQRLDGAKFSASATLELSK